MSSLPLISHHLFVAAIAPETRRPRRNRAAEKTAATNRAAAPVPLELLAAEDVLPRAGRPPKPVLAAV
jgi:hypothetical protein